MASIRTALDAIRPPVERPAGGVEGIARGRVLVGFDGRSGSTDALALAKAVATAVGAEIEVVSIRPYALDALGPEGFEEAVEADVRWIRHQSSQVLGDLEFEASAPLGGDVAPALKDAAVAAGARLIVLGASERHPRGRVRPGGVGERVLDGAPCAVAIAPRGLAAHDLSFGEIAVGYDGSRAAAQALRAAVELAEPSRASLLLLGVAEVRRAAGQAGLAAEASETARVERHLRRAIERVPPSLTARSRLVRGSAGRALAEAARGADLLVLGSGGHYGGPSRLALGSVGSKVVRSASCPTLIVPTP